MMKVRNKKVIQDIAVKTYKANLKRNLFTIFSIVITTFMITAVLALAMSYEKTISIRKMRMNGMDYDIALTEPEEKQVEQIRAMDNVSKAGLSVKCAVGEKYNGKILDELQFYWMDQTAWKYQCTPALEYYKGYYPKEKNEIMLSVQALNLMGITNPKIGMKLPLTWYSLADSLAGESVEQEFTLCGFFKDYAGWERGFVSDSFYQHTGAKQTDFMQGTLMITMKNPIFSQKDIEAIKKIISISSTQMVEGDVETITNFVRTVIVLGGLFLMLLLSGALFIYNMMLISVSKDITYYGQLKTIGMTSIQLKSIVNKQVIWNCIIGIPIGLLSGILVSKIIIPFILTSTNSKLEPDEIMLGSPWICLIAALFSLLTYWIGSRKPAQVLEKYSAIEAIRYTNSTKRRKKRSESVSLMSMAWSNLFRSRRQAYIILFSFVISMVMIWIIQTVIQENDVKRVLNTIYDYDIRLINDTILDNKSKNLITEEKIDEVKKISGIKNVGTVISADAIVPYQNKIFDEYYRNLYQSRYMPSENYEEDMEYYKENPEESIFTSRIIGIDLLGFDKLNKKLNNALDKEKFESGKTAVIISGFGLEVGDVVGKELFFWISNGSPQNTKQKIEISAVGKAKDLPAYFSRGYSPEIIVSQSYLKQLINKPVTELIEVSYETPFSDITEEQVKNIFKNKTKVSLDSKLERYNDMKQNSTRVMILGNSMALILVFLAFLNYFNTMTADIQSRGKEFAILESIGMTTKQIRVMLTLEGIFYACISLFIGFIVGVPASNLVFHNLNIYDMRYLLPWREMIVPYIMIILLCIVVPRIIYYDISKGGIIERIKTERD